MATQVYMSGISLVIQYFTNLGLLANGGTVTTYEGGTTTPVTTYSDSTGTAHNPNPMTLSSTGRPVVGQAPVAFWVPTGTLVRLVVADAQGNQLVYLDNVPAIGDPASTGSLQTELANPASGSGVDLVANAIKSYDTFADVRAANTPELAGGQTLTIDVQGALSVGDGLGGTFYWSAGSTAADNGKTVLNPNNNSGNGRYLRRYAPPLSTAQAIPSNSTTDLGTAASNVVSITGSVSINSFGSSASLANPIYLVTLAAAASLVINNSAALLCPSDSSINAGAGDFFIAQYLGSGNWVILAYYRQGQAVFGPVTQVVSTNTQSITSSTVLTNDNQLSAALSAGTYKVNIVLLLNSASGTTQGYKFACTFSGSNSNTAAAGGVLTGNSVTAAFITSINNGSAVVATGIVATPGEDTLAVEFPLTVTAPGTLNVQFAQNSSSTNAVNRLPGSTLLIIREA